MIKIEEVHSTPSPRTNLVANKLHKKKEISFENLPQGTKNHFKKKLLPLALDTTGALKAWTTPCDDTIIEIWNIVFSAEYPIDEGDTDCYCFVVAKTLVSPFFFIILINCACSSTAGPRLWSCACMLSQSCRPHQAALTWTWKSLSLDM
jgi:hypothetical protein